MKDPTHCLWLSEHLDQVLSVETDEEQSREMREHLNSCESCRRTAELIRGERQHDSESISEGLAESVLLETSGKACGKVSGMLVRQLDEQLPHGDRELIEQHVSHCMRCRSFAETLTWMLTDLRAMGSAEPDEWFVVDVLRQTRQIRQKRAGVFVKIREWWTERRRSPLFELQTAYAGALMITLTFGVPNSWFGKSDEMSVEIRERIGEAMEQISEPLNEAASRTVSFGRQAWESSGGEITPRLRETTIRIESVFQESALSLRSVAKHAAAAARSAWNRRFLEATLHVESMGGEFRDFFAAIRGERDHGSRDNRPTKRHE